MARPTKLALAVATVLITVVALAGSAMAGDTLSQKEFLQEANTICGHAYDAIDTAVEQAFEGLSEDDEPSEAQVEAAVASVVSILNQAADDVENLGGAGRVETQVGKFLTQFRAVVDRFEDDPQAAYEAEINGYLFKKPDKTAKKIGLKSCAQRGASSGPG